MQSVSVMSIALWLLTNRALYLEEIATSACEMHKIEGSAKLTIHTIE